MIKTEFLIVGQGLAGTLLAFEMLQNNIDFRIISSPKKSIASQIAAGMFNPLVFKRLTKTWLADEILPVMDKTYLRLEQLLSEKFYFKKDILKPLAEHEKQLWHKRKGINSFSNYIKSVTDTAPIKFLNSADAYASVSGSGYVDLQTFLNSAKELFKSKNLLIEGQIDYSKIDIKPNVVTCNSVKTNKLIFCEGHHLIDNPYFYLIRMAPTKGELLLISCDKLSQKYILNKKIFVLPIGKKQFKVGSTFDWNDLTEAPTPQGLKILKDGLEHLISEKYKIKDYFVGIRPTIRDRRPVLGFHPTIKNFAVFNGLGAKGVMLGPYFAKQMINLLTTNNFDVNPEVKIERFIKQPGN